MVSIIILSYNTKNLLKNCLHSIYEHLKSIEFEVIVVDNASSDGSAEMITKDFKKTTLIKNKENVGFSKGCNIGASHAKGKYLVFLNSDTEFIDASLSQVIDLLNNHQDVGVVGGILKNKDGSYQRSYGKFYSLIDIVVFIYGGLGKDVGERITQKNNSQQEVDWVSGGYMVVRNDLYKELKGFDEHIFMYTEDMELCYRVHKRNYKVVVLQNSSVLHVGQGSSNRSFAIVHIYRGLLYFYKKHKSNFEYIIVKGLLVGKAYLAIFVGLLTNNSYLKKTYLEAIKF